MGSDDSKSSPGAASALLRKWAMAASLSWPSRAEVEAMVVECVLERGRPSNCSRGESRRP